jgi:AcrR family transcriptional regulator
MVSMSTTLDRAIRTRDPGDRTRDPERGTGTANIVCRVARRTARKARRPARRARAARRRATRRTPDFDRIVDVTIELLQRRGEGGLRIEDVQTRTGASKSSLYAHFGDRDGLVAAALGALLDRHVRADVEELRAIVAGARTATELCAGLLASAALSPDAAHDPRRMDRITVVAGTRGRPVHARAVAAAQARLVDELTTLLDDATRRGLVASRHSTRAIASHLQAMALGRTLAGLDAGRPADDDRRARELAADVLRGIMCPDCPPECC